MDNREKDIQELCKAILSKSLTESDYCSGGAYCPFCYKDNNWDIQDITKAEHEQQCPVLIAKDLSTNLK